jgi:hypothetical protein
MATQNPASAGQKKAPVQEKPQVKPWQIAIAAVLIIGYFVWLAMKFFGPAPVYSNKYTKDGEELTAKVSAQAGPEGDLSKVNPVDKEAFLKRMSGAPVNPRDVLIRVWKKNHH